MPRTLKLLLLLLLSALAAPHASAAVQSDHPDDIQTLAQAVKGERKKDPEAWFRLGIEYNRAGDSAKARAAFKQALKLRPAYVAARAGLAYTFFVEKKFDEAEREAYRGATVRGNTSDFTASHVLTAVRLQRYREVAVAALARANQELAKNPDAADWNLLKAEALIGLSIAEQEIPPDLSFPTKPDPKPDLAAQKAAREETRRNDKVAADCLEKYLRLAARPVANEPYLRAQLEALRFYSQEPESVPAADRTYASSEVSSRALITYKPAPGFTDEARDADAVGTVRLRATLAADGKVKHILVVMPLRHGLSERSVEAARSIKFRPATVNETPVSQHVILEYNFAIH